MPFDPTQPYSVETTDGGQNVYVQSGTTYTINGVAVSAPATNQPDPEALSSVINQAEDAWDDPGATAVLPQQSTATLQGLVAQYGGTWSDAATAYTFLATFHLR